MQIHRFMEHSKASCLDLQFILPETAAEAKDIQKTIIFVNSITEMQPMMEIIQAWMVKKNYPESSIDWIKPYYSTMSDNDKAITTKEFRLLGEENTECAILVATNAYDMGIDNPDDNLVVQWDHPRSFDTMIQRMGRAVRKGDLSTFVLFSPKWAIVKNPQEIEQRLAGRKNQSTSTSGTALYAQLSATNRPIKASTSRLGQVVSADDVSESDISDAESMVDSEFDADTDDLDMMIFSYLATDAEERHTEQIIKKKRESIDATKRANIPDEIFHYIHVARCRTLFSLAWYDDLTYAIEEGSTSAPKAQLAACCNGPSCQSTEPACLQRKPFIELTVTRLSESDREWIACRAAELRRWRKNECSRYSSQLGVQKKIPDCIIMSDCCLSALAKNGESLIDKATLVEFLDPWYGVDKHWDKILACIFKNSARALEVDPPVAGIPSETERKDILQAARLSKKLKGMDDPVVAKAIREDQGRDKWLVEIGKADGATKKRVARLAKKAADAATKLAKEHE